tara:strand:- start:220783 stop:221397 length:615 start_codon:yes stop_codon:yes gene_type:complete
MKATDNPKVSTATTHSSYGFSVIELVITLALLAVMLTVAAPAFTNIFENNALAGTANRFITSLALARSEAISRNRSVTMCRLNASNNGCASNGNWEDGWIIWADVDGDGTLEATNQDGDVEVINAEEALGTGYTLRALNNQFTNRITFSPIGEATGNGGNQQEIFRLCDPDNDSDKARLIYLNGVGNAWVNRNSGSTSSATDCP